MYWQVEQNLYGVICPQHTALFFHLPQAFFGDYTQNPISMDSGRSHAMRAGLGVACDGSG